jgi:hypothetical protein
MHRRTPHQDSLHWRLVENKRHRHWQAVNRYYDDRNTGSMRDVLRLASRHTPGSVAYADLRPLLDGTI